MSGIAEYPVGLRRSAVSVSEFSILLMVSLATVTGVVMALVSTPRSTQNIALPVFVFGAGAMFGLGLTDLARAREVRFARALIIAGVLWSLSALTASDEPVLYSLGHVSQWGVDLAIAYLLLSYPAGRLADRTSRALFAAGALLVGLLFLPTVLAGEFPHPSLWSTCTSGCPHNTFSLGRSTPALVGDVVVPLREVLAVALFAAIAVAIIRRAVKAEPLLGQLYTPIAAFAVLQAVVFGLYFPLRAVAPASGALSVVSWIFVLSLPAAAVACSTGRLYRRIHAADALERIAAGLSASASAAEVRVVLADVLQDPSLRILHSFPGDPRAWVDESGGAAQLPRAAARRVTQVSSGKCRIALIHDARLSEDRALVLSAGSYALAALENHCLTDELHQSVGELAKTRARGLTAEQDTRQKIERDLHDGAQQHLVALRVKLGLAANRLAACDPAGAEVLHALEADVDATIDEVRSLARGIYPPLLARTGLRDALSAAGRSAAVPTTVHAEHLRRYPAEIETTVYFSCSEALQNAAKHARASTDVTISVWEDGDLHFEVRDDGAGFDLRTTPYGTGLSNLRDRLAAVGGSISLQSNPGQGTVVGGSIPLA